VCDEATPRAVGASPVRAVSVSQAELGSPIVPVVTSTGVTRSVLPQQDGRPRRHEREISQRPAVGSSPPGGLPSSCRRRAFSVATPYWWVLRVDPVPQMPQKRRTGRIGGAGGTRFRRAVMVLFNLSPSCGLPRKVQLRAVPGRRKVRTALCRESLLLWRCRKRRILPTVGRTGVGQLLLRAQHVALDMVLVPSSTSAVRSVSSLLTWSKSMTQPC